MANISIGTSDGDYEDITSYVNVHDIFMKTSAPSKPHLTGSHTFTWDFPSAVNHEIKFTLAPEALGKILMLEQDKLMHMEHKGRYWFDVHYTADVIMTNLQEGENGSFTATYLGMNIKDFSDRRWLARFLRWLTHRGN